jgi:hypothetical protein
MLTDPQSNRAEDGLSGRLKTGKKCRQAAGALRPAWPVGSITDKT